MPTLTITDQTTFEREPQTLTLDFLTEIVTVREIIRSRVYEEVRQYNARKSGLFRGLVQPTDAEVALNGFKLRKPRQINWEEQYASALESFQANGFLLLVNDRQVDDLDELVRLKSDANIVFIKLFPLVGG
ncbi:hypothetical protein [Candidatus Leptofilum sp.]|uniref:hypothetical protein n=1 Tax=Candidatus Leptofilum sp. TaxID=3241576 RepID=UPI003B59E9AE